MKQLKSLFALSKKQAAVLVGTGAIVAAPFTMAAEPDYASMIGDVASAGAVAAIVAMGVVKIAPNFAKWAVNKVASFF